MLAAAFNGNRCKANILCAHKAQDQCQKRLIWGDQDGGCFPPLPGMADRNSDIKKIGTLRDCVFTAGEGGIIDYWQLFPGAGAERVGFLSRTREAV